MSWARFDDQMAFHAKVLAAGNEAVGAWARMIAHCCAHLTDGKVARSVALSIAKRPKVLADLVDVGLLEVDGNDFAVHDFLDWNPPSEEIKAKRLADKLRKEAARKGQGRGSDGRINSAGCPPGQPAAVQTESEIRPPVPSPVSRLPSPVPDPKEIQSEICEGAGAAHTPVQTSKPRNRKPETDCPPSGEDPTAWLAANGIPALTSNPEVQRFLDHHRSKQNRFRDWAAAWRTWESGRFAPSATRLKVVQQAPEGGLSFWERPKASG